MLTAAAAILGALEVARSLKESGKGSSNTES
jgi:hypothetical protein